MEKPVILCVDDEKSVLNALRDEIKFEVGADYSIEVADSGEEGLEVLEDVLSMGGEVPVVISDQLMPGMKGDEFLAEVYKRAPEIRKILLTGQASADAVGNAVNNARLYRYITKPWDANDLMMTLREAARSYRQDRELDARMNTLKDISSSTQGLSEEIAVPALLEKILQFAVGHTRADKGLILYYQNGAPAAALVSRQKDDGGFTHEPLQLEALEGQAPAQLLARVRDEQAPLVLDKAFRDPEWSDDPHIKAGKIRSLYAGAVRKNRDVIGVLYLEAARTAGHFDELKQEYLSVLLRQAGVSLDNAQLYEGLERRVEERTREIERQKSVIEEKNTDITDSIRYAKRIQVALLSPPDILERRFPESFVLYQPRDIVSGDFYWFAEVGDYVYVAAVDCTGHGVPGAFMSVLGNALLNEIVLLQNVTETGEILNLLHSGVVSNLEQHAGADKLQDGMDLALCRFDKTASRLQFAGAQRPLVLLRDGELIEYAADRLSIGYSVILDDAQVKEFSGQEIDVRPGDRLYIFSDGVTDQFGGERGKKLGKKAFLNKAVEIQDLDARAQKEAFAEYLREWQGDKPQTDDMILIYIRL